MSKKSDRKIFKSIKSNTRKLRWKCFWTWPFGHDYSLIYNQVTLCCYCRKPYPYSFDGVKSKLNDWQTAEYSAVRDELL